ncbi:MAG TPA: cytochrome C [Geobacter sp.]|nr:cytochrome C [Geobacter sp.]
MTKYGTLAGGDPEAQQERVCSYCHTPHHAIVDGSDYLPLWSHTLTKTTFTPYKSGTLDAKIDAASMMEGPSKLCMSCHDGTIAVDTHYSFTGTKMLNQDDSLFGTAGVGVNGGLNNDHPIGFVYDGTSNPNGIATGPAAGDPDVSAHIAGKDPYVRNGTATYIGTTLKIEDRLYLSATQGGKGIMTCSTCHDVHNKINQDESGATNYLLLASNKGSSLCLSCHIK